MCLCPSYEDSESDAPQTEAEREMTDLWHIGLHYLLPIIDWLHLHDRTVTETRESEREGKENAAPVQGEREWVHTHPGKP